MWFFQLLVLFAVYSVGPGLFFLRRTRLGPGEKLVASVGLSYLLVYLLSFGWYLTRLGERWHVGVSLICLGLTLACGRTRSGLFRHRQVRRMLAAFGLFLVWGLLLLSFVRHYGGGTWSGDWIEQYQRTIFFLHRRPLDTLMIGTFPLPARPPMMNLIAASLLAQIAPQYDVFQLVYLFLNAMVFLPACLIARDLVAAPAGGWSGWSCWSSPPARWWRRTPRTRGRSSSPRSTSCSARTCTCAAGGRGCGPTSSSRSRASAGFLVHHSAGPYALFLGLHYVTVVFWRRRGRWAEAATIAVVSLAILLTWFGWSVHTYGRRTTFTSQSTISDAPPTFAANVANIGRNLGNTLLPTVLRNPGIMHIEELEQENTAGRVRDFTFLMYQVSLTYGLGSVGARWRSICCTSCSAGAAARSRSRPKWSFSVANDSSGSPTSSSSSSWASQFMAARRTASGWCTSACRGSS